MANVNEPEQESDEDCEVYFLKPVNEYNIVDKIKEANKELFSPESANEQEPVVIELMSVESSTNRKVKFASNLEEYEPLTGISTKELEETLGKAISSEESNDSKLKVIKEEDSPTNDEENSKINGEQLINEMKREESLDNLKESSTSEELDQSKPIEVIVQEDIILEEICEEILIMDMESEKPLQLLDTTKSESPGALQRRMLKQITFDYDEEQDNKSLTNLLISDNENDDDSDEEEEYNCNESVNEETDTDEKLSFANNNEFYNDEDEDDKLSIIIASYLPDDLIGNNNSITSEKSSPRSYRKSRKLPFNKRFSFRRKSKSSNAIAACSGVLNSNKHRFVPPPEVTDLKLHYKTCCEFKNGQQKLPNYTGYLSEYGLSREQLFERERKLQHKHHGLLQDTLKTSEDDMRKMHDNERAFTKWLKNKMRFPINKTRNMFDVKRPFGLRKYTSVGGGNSLDPNEESNMITNTTKYRSISAKIRKG